MLGARYSTIRLAYRSHNRLAIGSFTGLACVCIHSTSSRCPSGAFVASDSCVADDAIVHSFEARAIPSATHHTRHTEKQEGNDARDTPNEHQTRVHTHHERTSQL